MKKDKYKEAKKRVNDKKGFYSHLASFIIVNIGLFLINMLTSPGYPWFLYPLIGWGIGLASHYVTVFGIPGLGVLSKDWEDREYHKELQRLGEEDEDLELPPMPEKEKTPERKWNEDDLV